MKSIVSMNEWVSVRLTDHGLLVLKNQHDELQKMINVKREFKAPAVDADGYTKFQLWDLFATFGEHIGPCNENCFELDIVFG